MAKTDVQKAEEFKKAYKEFMQIEALGNMIREGSEGWTAAKDTLLAKVFKDKALVPPAIASASSPHDSTLDRVSSGYKKYTYGKAAKIYSEDREEIIGEIDGGRLEAMLGEVPLIKLAEEHARSEAHNPAVDILKTQREVSGINEQFDKNKMNAVQYTNYISGIASRYVEAIFNIKEADKEAKELLVAALIELAQKSPNFARAAGNTIVTDRVNAFVNHFNGQTANGYTIPEFVRNNLLYADPKETMPLVGKYLNADLKKKK